MTPEERQQLQEYLQKISEILYRDTPKENLKDFETIEHTVRNKILTEVAPQIGEFFFIQGSHVLEEELEK